MQGQRTVLFIDEIHRFNKAQQDAILPYVEDGTVILIGATTENPSFEVNSPLLSRSRVIVLQSLTDADIEQILRAALADSERGLGGRNSTSRRMRSSCWSTSPMAMPASRSTRWNSPPPA